jgi:tRNA/rRNA methyltransferase
LSRVDCWEVSYRLSSDQTRRLGYRSLRAVDWTEHRFVLVDFRVILVEPSFEESIGFVARAMKNFGLSNLHVVNPIAVLGPEGRSRGGHAQDVLDSIVQNRSLEEALQGLDLAIGTTAQKSYASSNLVRKPMTPKEFSTMVKKRSGTVGIVFGREGTGLTNSELAQCDATLTIPANSDYQTLNLSHAAVIVFYELYDTLVESSTDGFASEQVKKTILRFLSESAELSGMEQYKRGLLNRACRNILGRSGLRHREGSLLAEALRRISETLTHVKNPEHSETPLDVSESDTEPRDWTQESITRPRIS